VSQNATQLSRARTWFKSRVAGARTWWARVPKAASWLVHYLVLPGAFITLGVLALNENGFSLPAVGVATGLLILAVLSWAVKLEDVRQRAMSLESLSAAGLSAQFHAEVKTALTTMPAVGGDEPREEDPNVTDIAELRVLLEGKLAYVAKHILAERAQQPGEDQRGSPVTLADGGYNASFATIGSLVYDGYLQPDQGAICHRILALPDKFLQQMSEKERTTILKDGRKVVERFRAAVFEGLVKKTLMRVEGSTVKDVSIGELRGFLCRSGRSETLVVAILDVPYSNADLGRTRERLRAVPDDWHPTVVVPNLLNRTAPTSEPPRVVRLDGLQEAVVSNVDPLRNTDVDAGSVGTH